MDKLAVRVFFGSAMLTIANEIWTFFSLLVCISHPLLQSAAKKRYQIVLTTLLAMVQCCFHNRRWLKLKVKLEKCW